MSLAPFKGFSCIFLGFLASFALGNPAPLSSEVQLIDAYLRLEIELELAGNNADAEYKSLFQSMNRKKTPRAWLYFRAGLVQDDSTESDPFFADLLKEAEAFQDKNLSLLILTRKAKLDAAQGRPQPIILETYQRAQDICRDWQDPLWCGRLYADMGAYYYEINDHGSATLHVKEGLKLLETLKGSLRYYYYNGRTLLAVLLDSSGREKQALVVREENLQWYRENRYISNASLECINIVGRLIREKSIDRVKALKYLDLADQLVSETNDNVMKNNLRYVRGRFEFETANYTAAQQLMDAAYTEYLAQNNSKFAALSILYKARSDVYLKEMTAAKKSLDIARRILPDDYSYEKIMLWEAEYLIAKSEGRVADALASHEKFHQFWKQSKEKDEIQQRTRLTSELGLEIEEQKRLLLEHQNAAQTQRAIFLGMVGLLILLLLVLTLRQKKTIQARQEKLSRILDNIEDGILTIDKARQIEKEYSKRTPEILGSLVSPEDLSFEHKVLKSSQLSNEDQNITLEVLTNCLGEDAVAWEFNAVHLPRELTLKQNPPRTITLRWAPLLDRDNRVERVLISMTDVSEERLLAVKLEQERDHVRNLPRQMQEILGASPTHAAKLMNDLLEVLNLIRSEGALPPHIRTLHTCKGVARALGLASISHQLHDLESTAAKANATEVNNAAASLVRDVEHMTSILKARNSSQAPTEPEPKPLWLADALSPYFKTWMEHAETHDITIQGLELHDEVLLWNPLDLEIVAAICLHGINNTLDHGFIAARLKDKDSCPPALIAVRTERKGTSITLRLTDNGGGLDMPKLKNLAQARGFIPQGTETLADVVFLDGLSTAEKTSLSSGRGVGMSAIKDLVERNHGVVRIQNNPGARGTTLVASWKNSYELGSQAV